MRTYRDFTDFLNYKFYKQNPMTLDDDWIDAYSDWLAEQDPDDLVKWADEYAGIVKAGKGEP